MKKLIVHIYGDENNFLESLKEIYKELKENRELKSVRWNSNNNEIDLNILDYSKHYTPSIIKNDEDVKDNYKKLPPKKSVPKK